MALIVCKMCKRAFINSAEGEEICPECMNKVRELYPKVRNFLRDNEKQSYTPYEVSQLLGIDIKSIEGLVALGLIETRGSAGAKDSERKPLKIRPLSAKETKELALGKSDSFMHAFDKKNEEKRRKRKP